MSIVVIASFWSQFCHFCRNGNSEEYQRGMLCGRSEPFHRGAKLYEQQ